MGRYFIIAIMLYALVVGVYLLWERNVKRKRNAAREKVIILSNPLPKKI